eukprot:scaffold426959_cov33-Prasinocladus_malaysianus.AAC.1
MLDEDAVKRSRITLNDADLSASVMFVRIIVPLVANHTATYSYRRQICSYPLSYLPVDCWYKYEY